MKWYPQEPVLTQSEFKPATTNCKPNPYFFLQSIIFQVADELFQIPSIVFPESEIFNELYPGVLERNGAPVVLRDCTKRQFEALLTVVLHPYSQMFTSRHPCKELLHLQVLLPALELAKKWCFHRLCQDISAQSGLLMSSPVEKVTFGLRYTVQSWFHRGLEQLIASDDDISQKDAEAVGLPLALRVYRARAKYAKGARGDSEITTTDVSDIVKDMFADELAMFSTSASDTDETESLLNTESEAETIVVTSAPDGSFVEVGQHQTPSSLTSSEYVTSKDPPPTHAPLGASKSTSTNAATPESSDGQTDGAILDETQKKVVEDVRQIILTILDSTGAARKTSELMSLVPRKCMMNRCYDQRCVGCCQKKAKELQGLEWFPKAKTTLGQACLEHVMQKPGVSSSSGEILRSVPKACSTVKLLCGEPARCWNCIVQEASNLMQAGDMI